MVPDGQRHAMQAVSCSGQAEGTVIVRRHRIALLAIGNFRYRQAEFAKFEELVKVGDTGTDDDGVERSRGGAGEVMVSMVFVPLGGDRLCEVRRSLAPIGSFRNRIAPRDPWKNDCEMASSLRRNVTSRVHWLW